MTDPESTSLLQQAEAATIQEALTVARSNGLDATVTTDGRQVQGEVSASHAGESWWMRAWARVTAKKGEKPDTSAGVSAGIRWFGGWDR